MCHSAALRKGLRVLVVDGDADSRELLMILLEDHGIEAIAATCVRESLEIMQNDRPDLLISEITLPGEDGYSLVNKVKAIEIEYQTRIPAIALTVFSEESARAQALAAGFCQHLAKPFNIDTLMALVTHVTGQAQEVAMTPCH